MAIADLDHDLAVVHAANSERLRRLRVDTDGHRDSTRKLLREVNSYLGGERGKPPAETLSVVPGTVLPARPVALLAPTWPVALGEAESYLRDLPGSRQVSSTVDLLSEDDLAIINEHLARPMYQRIPWDRWDWIVAFGAGLSGGLIDIFLGTPGHFVQKAMADKDHWLGEWMNGVHSKHVGNAPIDYQAKPFAGGFHRGLSSGHDLARPLAGIRQFQEGHFTGWYFKDGVRYSVESFTTPGGTPYPTMTFGAAAIAWLVHNFCDFFSTYSLPIPGTSWAYEMGDHELRHFVQAELYQHGINLRHVALQTLAPLSVEVALRTYFSLRYRHSDAPSEALRQKRAELLTLGHCVSTAFNIGKLVVLKDPTMLNVPQLMFTMRHLLGLIILEQQRNSFVRKFQRNATDLTEDLARLEATIRLRVPQPLVLA